MKYLKFLFIIGLATHAMGQDQKEISTEYRKHVKAGNFLTNWIYDLRGTSTVWIEELTLLKDSTYIWEHYGGDCANDIRITGTWKIKSDTLLLNNNSEVSDAKYIMKGNKLFYPLSPERKNWVMKLQ